MVYVVRLQSDLELRFMIRRNAEMRRVMDLFSSRLGIEDYIIRFFAKGERVRPQDTAETLEMKDGDTINCVVTSIAVITITVKDQVSSF
jgi:hypothetical protein